MLHAFLLMLTLGFVSSLHCVGMCGGLIGALSLSRPRLWWPGLLSYQLGRVAVYGVLGLIGGWAGGSLGTIGAGVPRMLAWLAGGVMVLFGLNMAGVLPDPLTRLGRGVKERVKLVQLSQRAAHHPSPGNWGIMGMANGLLPCGLVYMAIGLGIASGSGLQSAAMMVGFGLGTVPAMVLAPLALRRLTPRLRGRGVKLAGVILVLLGLLTAMRGEVVIHGEHGFQPTTLEAPLGH